ncbi:MAG: hypothetical protein KA397_00650 [Paludibacteraceae bacterium]|nr:hypothetical protein [Paludibacteraceae bacterium]MBP6283877.1 hypothetical protein [Paludibacteraceae bacterium]
MRKIFLYIVLICLSIFISGCVSEPADSSIPYGWVSFDIDVSRSGTHSSLRRDMLGNMLIFSTTHPSILSSSLNSGYGYGGVIVIRAMDNELYAFDAACPYEHSAEVILKNDGYFVSCPVCKTQYDIAWGWGIPNTKTGPGKERLKRYRLNRVSEDRYRVVN